MIKYYVNNQEIAFEELYNVLSECNKESLKTDEAAVLELVDAFVDTNGTQCLYFETSTYGVYY